MTLKSRLYTTALAIGLSTPAAAATITVSLPHQDDFVGYDYVTSLWHFNGPATVTEGFRLARNDGASVTLSPEPPLVVTGLWGYQVEAWNPAKNQIPDFDSPYVIANACYLSGELCHPEHGGAMNGGDIFHVGDFIRLTLWWNASGGALDKYNPDILLNLRVPDGVTLSQNPLPASWVLLASMLGLGGLFRWAKRRVVAP